MAKTFSKDDVASHSKGDSPWIIIDEDVYDVSKFQDEHPGKASNIQKMWLQTGMFRALVIRKLKSITC